MAEAASVGYYNPNLRKQGEKSRRLAAERAARRTAEQDPRTYGFVSGLIGEAYDDNPISVLDPRRAKAQKAKDVGMAVGTAAEIVPGLSYLRKPAKAVGKSALKAVNDAHLYGEGFLGPFTPQVQNIIRTEKGGNWWPGSIERNLTGDIKKSVLNETGLQNLEARQGRDVVEAYKTESKKDYALNRWIDKKLKNYVQTEMGSPDDSIRKMAEAGKDIHVGSENLPMEYDSFKSGEPMNIISTNPLARQWESTVDSQLGKPKPASEWKEVWSRDREGAPEWLHNLPDETPILEVERMGGAPRLGFHHLVDELRNAMDPASGLPQALRFTPEQLDKITVPQAVERVAKINEWRAARQVEANQAKARNPATEIVKTYDKDNPKGLHWVELKAPIVEPKMPPDIRIEGPNNVGVYYAYEYKDGNKYAMGGADSPEEAMAMATRNAATAAKADSRRQLQEALTYEGDTMGHCVGGYCDPVFNSRQRIFSLRDSKGQPHVTIEMQPAGSEKIGDIKAGLTKNWEIHQVKGKGNLKPKDEYIPYVQDFIKSEGVNVKRDLKNTELVKTSEGYKTYDEVNKEYQVFDDQTNEWVPPIDHAKSYYGKDWENQKDTYMTGLGEQISTGAEYVQKVTPPTEPFWFNAKTGAHAPMSPEAIHAQMIQDPEYAAKLGVTPEQATAYPLAPEAEPLITGRQTGNRLSLVGLGTPTDETLAATQTMLRSNRYRPEVVDFGGGERLWEGMTPDDLLNAKTLQDLDPYKKYKSGGTVTLSRYSKQR